MFELMVNFSRILFLLYLLIFLYSGVLLMLDEAGFTNEPHGSAIFLGRIMIILTHITAFLILAYDKEAIGFDWKVLAVAAVSLLFFILANHLANILFEKSFPLIWNCVFFLLDIGLIMLWRLNSALAYKQLVWMVLGFFVAMWIPFILRLIPRFEQFQWLYIIVSFVLVIATLALGQTQYGSTNWISFGFGQCVSQTGGMEGTADYRGAECGAGGAVCAGKRFGQCFDFLFYLYGDALHCHKQFVVVWQRLCRRLFGQFFGVPTVSPCTGAGGGLEGPLGRH